MNLLQAIGDEPQTEPFEGAPGGQANYVGGGFREALGRFLAGGLYPRELNLPAARAKGREETLSLMPAGERAEQRAYDDMRADVRRARRLFRATGEGLPDEYEELRKRRRSSRSPAST